MQRILKIVSSIFLICITYFTFYTVVTSQYFSYGYANLPFFRFGTVLNYCLIGLLVIINIDIISINRIKNDLPRLCLEIFIISFLAYTLFLTLKYSYIIFMIILFLTSIVTVYYRFLSTGMIFRVNSREYIYYSRKINERSFQILFLVLFITLPIYIFYENTYKSNLIQLVDNEYSTEMDRIELLNENYAKFEVFYKDDFSDLSNIERLDLLQEVELLESRLAGRPAQKIQIEELEENNLGYFNDKQHTINISEELISSNEPLLLLEVLLHESRHATQFYLINSVINNEYFRELTFYENIELIKENYLDYINFNSMDDNLYDYQNQPVEIDAQYHAIIALMDYEEVFNPKIEEDSSSEIPSN